MMTTTGNGLVTDEVVRGYLALDPALYSIWMPEDITTVLIQSKPRLIPWRPSTSLLNAMT
jgi:hypothetical protein